MVASTTSYIFSLIVGKCYLIHRIFYFCAYDQIVIIVWTYALIYSFNVTANLFEKNESTQRVYN